MTTALSLPLGPLSRQHGILVFDKGFLILAVGNLTIA